MRSELRSEIDIGWPKAATLRALELLDRYVVEEGYQFRGEPENFSPMAAEWMGRFYAYYQWHWNVKSAWLVEKVSPRGLLRMYPGAHSKSMKLVIEELLPSEL